MLVAKYSHVGFHGQTSSVHLKSSGLPIHMNQSLLNVPFLFGKSVPQALITKNKMIWVFYAFTGHCQVFGIIQVSREWDKHIKFKLIV